MRKSITLLICATAAISLAGCKGGKSNKGPKKPSKPPVVSSVNPVSGNYRGGTRITLAGSGFRSGAKVTIDGFGCTNATVSADGKTLTCDIPTVYRGSATYGHRSDIVLTNPNGKQSTLSSSFTYTVPNPQITSITPNRVVNTGGTVITLTGTGFEADLEVSIGGNTCRGALNADRTQYSCTMPRLTGQTGGTTVYLTHPISDPGYSHPFYGRLTLENPAPTPLTVRSIYPTSGPVTGGTRVTITGTGFQNGSRVTTTTYHNFCENILVSADGTTLTCTTTHLLHAGVVQIYVTHPDGRNTMGQALYFTLTAPAATGGGTGTGAGTAATGTGTGTGTGAGAAGTRTGTATAGAAPGPTHSAMPSTVDSINPPQVQNTGGDVITITGRLFADTQVLINGSPCTGSVINASLTRVFCSTPALPGTVGPVTVRIISNASAIEQTIPNMLTYTAPAAPRPDPAPGAAPAGPAFSPEVQAYINGGNLQAALWIAMENGASVAATRIRQDLSQMLSGRRIREADFGAGVVRGKKLLTYANGRQALFKPENLPSGETEGSAEIAAYELDTLLGLGVVPATIELINNEGTRGSAQFMFNTGTEVSVCPNPDRPYSPSNIPNLPSMRRIQVLDYLIGNSDRYNGNNCMIWRGRDGIERAIAIDNGHAFKNYHGGYIHNGELNIAAFIVDALASGSPGGFMGTSGIFSSDPFLNQQSAVVHAHDFNDTGLGIRVDLDQIQAENPELIHRLRTVGDREIRNTLERRVSGPHLDRVITRLHLLQTILP